MRSQLAWLAPIGSVVGLAMPLYSHAGAQDDLSMAPRISLAEFEKLLRTGGVTVIDVRDGVSYGAGHIPGAILMPLGALENRVPELKAAARPVVVYCA
jgi:3-mercaptopyruvate sulfurtransferase SseA